MMGNNLPGVSSSPHVRNKASTRSIMMDVCIAMLPASIFGIIQFGVHALLVILISIASSVLAEYVWEKCMHKPVTISDFSAVVTGMILALNMPPKVPLWIPVIGSVFAIIIVKQLYGGLGANFINPALSARAFLLISFAGIMSDFSTGVDTLSGATPLTAMRAGETVNLGSLITGVRTIGTIGEISAIALLAGAVYLLVRRVITIRIPLTYVLSFAIFVFLFGGFDPYYVCCQIFAGGLIFGAFYMANDYVTSPITPLGQTIYAIVLGVLTGIFRLWGASPEGVSYAIILGNLTVPLIERLTIPVAFGKTRAKGGKKA